MTIDIDNLAAEFNMDSIERAARDTILDIEGSAKEVNTNDPDSIIGSNIGKANAILDNIIRLMNSGNFSPRMGEVAGQLINAINSATSQLYQRNATLGDLQYKGRVLQLRERELEIKEKLIDIKKGSRIKNQNLIITSDRETILKVLKNKDNETKVLEYKEDVEDKGDNDGRN